MRLSDDDIRGRTVISADGLAIGEVAAVFIDSDAWRVEALKVELRKDMADQLGAERSMFQPATIEVPVQMVQSVGDAVILGVAADALQQVVPSATATMPGH